MTSNFFSKITFLKSAAELKQLPPDEGAEVAFVGRSNAGKSSALNVIAGIKRLARVSDTPGRTQLINYFAIDDSKRLVDLPGYGYAKVPLAIKERWQETLARYLQQRHSLRGLILLMDSRHPLKELDQNFIFWANEANIPLHILLTKTDKISRNAAMQSMLAVKKFLKQEQLAATIQLFSSPARTGIEEAQQKIIGWLESKAD